jgi:hypothetical protein
LSYISFLCVTDIVARKPLKVQSCLDRLETLIETIGKPKDDPFLRHIASILDLGEQDLSKLKLRALEHARHMPISDDGSLPSPTEDFSQQAMPGKTNWLQVGPTCIRDSQWLSSYYYYWPAYIPTSGSGRITSIIIHPKDRNVIYIGTALGGVWKTEDGGRNWVATSDYAPSLAIGTILF